MRIVWGKSAINLYMDDFKCVVAAAKDTPIVDFHYSLWVETDGASEAGVSVLFMMGTNKITSKYLT